MIAAFGGGRVESPSDATVETWWLLLKDVSEKAVLAAAIDLLSEPREWPPTPGQVRDRAIDIANGQLVPISPTEAWERACASSRGECVELTKKEIRALAVAGGTHALKTERAESTRAVFLAHYKTLCRMEKRISATVPEVAAAANLSARALPEKKVPVRRQFGPPKKASPEEVSELLKNYVRYDEMKRPASSPSVEQVGDA